MKNIVFLNILAALLCIAACNGKQDAPESYPPIISPEIIKGDFAEGADISWVTQMEKDGQKFYNAAGQERECTALMKEIGFNAIRLRVWVDPEEGWCGKDDVLAKAQRAQALGMRLMIDFHYSDSWADPGKQNPPAEWKNHDAASMKLSVKEHTAEVLQALRDEEIDVEWVQIGNEVNQGMLWPLGKVQNNEAGNFTDFLNAGYETVKGIYPDAKVIVHLSNGHDSGLYDWFLGLMKKNDAKYDIIGMSLYPTWWENGGWAAWKDNVDKCLANMKAVCSRFDKPVMLCEVGMPVSEPQTARQAMQYILDATRKMDPCHGVFYWEPQTDGVWKPSSYTVLGWNAYNMGAFSKGRPTAALEPFKD
jgi:arabinogalactan endo-1,4-beta-galactosidase